MKRKPAVKTPPRGGDAAAAWDHNLKPHEKEKLVEVYREEQARKMNAGRTAALTIAALNAAFAIASLIMGAEIIICAARLVISAGLYFGVPGIRIIFAAGTLVFLILLIGAGINANEAGIFMPVFKITDGVLMAASAITMFASETMSDYFYSKRNG
ncbi:MAG: hypothetical protein FWH17_01710 [Oscillospiraceae bacterium]|nr:hypothetical protein [Oscillospiraceae bacterium]